MNVGAPLTRESVVDFLAEIFARRGGEEYLGERVTMAEHMLQAAQLAEQEGESEPLVVAALLHDVGHFTGELGAFSMTDTEDRHHETAGAALLERFFPPLVTDCVRHHVAAKRYLCAARPAYLERLSAASLHSLRLQGGPMAADELGRFERLPNLEAIVKVRLLDDEAKVPGLPTPPFAHFAPTLRRIVDGHRVPAA